MGAGIVTQTARNCARAGTEYTDHDVVESLIRIPATETETAKTDQLRGVESHEYGIASDSRIPRNRGSISAEDVGRGGPRSVQIDGQSESLAGLRLSEPARSR